MDGSCWINWWYSNAWSASGICLHLKVFAVKSVTRHMLVESGVLQHRCMFYTCITNFDTSIYQSMNARIISHKTLLKHFKTLWHVSTLSDHHQGALFLAKVILQFSQFNSYLQTRCCGSISCCVGKCCGAVARCASHDAHLATAPQHNMICCHNTSFANTNWIVNTVI